ncbi:AraC family transcriptional regulator ligand-binding domain-containing protein, partial [Desulfobacterales bacterium HSG17]|nr:AraC family transcriptional regulator ligand-binding domain-containing protein [Desulfobacterales bacterium HSG17]
SVREGVTQYIRFIKLANEGDHVELRETKHEAIVIYTTENPIFESMPAMERNFSVAVTRMRRYAHESIIPSRVEFKHPEPEYTAEYQRIFQAPVLFEQAENRLIYPVHFLALDMDKSSTHLYSVFLQYAESLLSRMVLSRPHTKRARQFIVKHLADGDVAIEKVAHALHMSRQTLYRKLKKENTSFKALLEETRKNMAKAYLEQNEYSITDVAFLLGFSETSAFNRAFKRWHGKNPSDFRK